MKVKEIMTTDVTPCDLNANLAVAAQAMWEHDCGVLPVLKDGRELVGLITDRDICMGTATRDRHPSQISVEEVMSGQVYSVQPEDDLQLALEAMQRHKIRRLPVVDSEGELKGLLSINDLVLNAKEQKSDLSYGVVIKTLQAIGQHWTPIAAAATNK